MPESTEAWRLLLLALVAAAQLLLAARTFRHDRNAASLCLAALLLVGSGIAIWFALRLLPLTAQQRTFPLYHPLALGPLVYFHARARLGAPLRALALHAAPAALAFAYQLALFLIPSAAFEAWKERPHDHLIKPAIDYAILISLIAYAAASLQLAATAPASRPQPAVSAVRSIAWTLAGGAVLLSIFRIYSWFVAEIPDAHSFWVFLAISAAPFLFWRHDRPVRAAARETARDRAEELRAAGLRWKQVIVDQGWWREPDLTLHEAARRLGTNASYLSRALNRGVGQTFPELVNRARAEQVAHRLGSAASPERLLDLAFEAGFSSKATFNRAFRSAFGCAPSEYVSFHENRCDGGR